MKTKFMWRLTAILLLVFVAFACSNSKSPSPKDDTGQSIQKLDEINLRLKWLIQVHSAGEIVASTTGLCEKEGLKCNIKPGGPDFDSIKLVAAGEDDYGVTSADQLILARSKGIPIIAIGVLFQESPVCFFAKKQMGLKTPNDFLGKRIGVKFGTNAETEYVVLLKRAGIDRTKLKEVPVKFDLKPFLLGQVDIWPGIESNEPLTAEENGVEVDILRSRDFGIKTYSNVYFTTEERVRNNPDQIRRFMNAMAAGWKFVRENPDIAIEAVLKANNLLDKKHEQKALLLTLPIIFPDNAPNTFGNMTKEGWEATQSVLLDGGLLQEAIDLDKCMYTREK